MTNPNPNSTFDPMQNALNRMRASFNAGRGVRLSYTELEAMSLSFLGELWDQEDPRAKEEKKP